VSNSITTHNYRAISCESFFNSKHNPGKISTPTHGGDAFRVNSSNDRRFGSSELNLAFVGLLLGASRRRSNSCPHELGLDRRRVFTRPLSAGRYALLFSQGPGVLSRPWDRASIALPEATDQKSEDTTDDQAKADPRTLLHGTSSSSPTIKHM
jgi:hypothetical protein